MKETSFQIGRRIHYLGDRLRSKNGNVVGEITYIGAYGFTLKLQDGREWSFSYYRFFDRDWE